MSLRDIKVTVIMACYNSSAYIAESICSVLNQTLVDLELILIDDHSTDNTLEITKHFQARDNRISVISLPVNSGSAIARNAGIRVARAEWLGILDSDDIAVPSRFEEQMGLANGDGGLVMIGSNSISIDKHGRTIKEHNYPTDHRHLVNRLYSLQAFPPHSSALYKTDAVKKVAAFNPRYVRSEDYDLWLRLSKVGEISSVHKPLVKIRKHEGNTSNTDRGALQRRFGFAACICHFLRVHGHPDPAAGNDETAWQQFLTWVDTRLEEEHVFATYDTWADSRDTYFAAANRLVGALHFCARLLQSSHTRALMLQKLFGSSLPQRLAQEWIAARRNLVSKIHSST
jgi:glycosyltransferase involved in cell wall biosynthesis